MKALLVYPRYPDTFWSFKYALTFIAKRAHVRYLGAPLKSIVLLGIKDRARLYYWKLLFWSLFRRPRLLPMALMYLIYGFHFRKVFRAIGEP